MALPETWLAELRARTPLPALVGRKVRLKKNGKDWTGLCCFHNEKSPSFHVYEGASPHFHCFGCGEHGDAISFLMLTQGLPFLDAVTQLAAAAAMEVPKGPALQQAEQRRASLRDVLTAFAVDAQARLWSPAGERALVYLRGRGFDDATIRAWGIGWIGREPLPERAVEAGLARPGEGDEPPTPLFFDRVLFPITDHLGRIISVSGRALGDRKPKYVNGAESALFSKRRSLFGLERLRAGIAAGGVPILMEGQTDVIAAHQADITTAVAPLGTALTEEQLELLWKAHPCPVICFDGDEAGQRAMRKVLDLARPLIAPDRTLRFASLPSGEDPDAFIRRRGAVSFLETVIRPARAYSTALYDALREQADIGTPEGVAALRVAIEAAAGEITHKVLRDEYRRSLTDRVFEEKRALRAMRRISPVVPGQPVASDEERARQIAEVGSQIIEATAEWARNPSEQNERRVRAFVKARDEILRGDHAAPPQEDLQ